MSWLTVDFQVKLKEQILMSRALMGRELKFCLLAPCCHWLNLHRADVLCCTPVSPGLLVIPVGGSIETASGFHLPTSISFFGRIPDELEKCWVSTILLQHEQVAKAICGPESMVSNRVPVPLRQVCGALLMTVDTLAHL